MGSGKTSVTDSIAKTEFWAKYGRRVVVIEADKVKMKDPVFIELSQLYGGATASSMVHEHSTKAAEELFCSAVRMRRGMLPFSLNE